MQSQLAIRNHERAWVRGTWRVLWAALALLAAFSAGPVRAQTLGPLGVYVAEPISAATGKWLDAERAGAVRAAVDRALGDLCRPQIEVDEVLGRLSAKTLLRLVAKDAKPGDGSRPALGKSPRARDLIVTALRPGKTGITVEIAALDVKTGKLRGRAAGIAKTAAALGAAVEAAAARIKALLPCPVWRGEIVLTTTETRAERGKGFSRTGQAEWTLLTRVDGKRIVLDGRYTIRVVTQRCNALGKDCSVNVLQGAGSVEAAKGAASGFDPGKGTRYTITVGDAVARLKMTTRLCLADSGKCKVRRFETEQALPGARSTGTVWQSEDSVFGSVTLVDTPKKKRVMSWQLERVLD